MMTDRITGQSRLKIIPNWNRRQSWSIEIIYIWISGWLTGSKLEVQTMFHPLWYIGALLSSPSTRKNPQMQRLNTLMTKNLMAEFWRWMLHNPKERLLQVHIEVAREGIIKAEDLRGTNGNMLVWMFEDVGLLLSKWDASEVISCS